MDREGAGVVGGIVAVVLGVVLVTVLWGSWYTVEQGERAVVLRNGALHRVDDPGLHFKLPIVDARYDMEVRTKKLVKDKLNTYSRDNQAAELRVSINYRLDPARIGDVFSTLGRNYEERLIDPTVFKIVKDVFGQWGAGDVILNRDKMAQSIYKAMAEALADNGIIVEGVQMENIDFDDAYEAAIRNAMQAEAEVRKQRQILEQNKVNAETIKVQADAAAYRRRTEADAEAFHIEAKGKAEASAIAQRADALRKNQDLIGLIAAEKWDGKLPATMVPGSTVPFIGVK